MENSIVFRGAVLPIAERHGQLIKVRQKCIPLLPLSGKVSFYFHLSVCMTLSMATCKEIVHAATVILAEIVLASSFTHFGLKARQIATKSVYLSAASGGLVSHLQINQEQSPVFDALAISNCDCHRQLSGNPRLREQTQTRLVRETIRLPGVDLLVRQDAVLPRRLATARTRDNVIDAAFLGTQRATGVLATIAVALANVARRECRALLRHLRVVRAHDDRRHADRPARRVNTVVLLTNRQRDPLVPRHGTQRIRSEEH